jgi:hypothetical protein
MMFGPTCAIRLPKPSLWARPHLLEEKGRMRRGREVRQLSIVLSLCRRSLWTVVGSISIAGRDGAARSAIPLKRSLEDRFVGGKSLFRRLLGSASQVGTRCSGNRR